MIIIDYSATAIATLTGGFMEELNTNSYEKIEDILRHALLSTIKSYKKQFSAKFGSTIVIAVDNKTYWRREVFPAYKAGRKKSREDSGINWTLIHQAMDATKHDLAKHFPYKVIDVEGAEADDVMAVISKYTTETLVTKNVLFGDDDPEQVLVITTDKDMSQLTKYKNVKVWNPRDKKQVKLEVSPSMFLKRLILKGDPGDGIPGVFSHENSFIDGIRQKPCTEAKMKPLLDAKTLVDGTTDPELIRRIKLNSQLIDFSYIPEEVSTRIINAFNTPNTNTLMTVMNYLISKNMKLMLKDVEQF